MAIVTELDYKYSREFFEDYAIRANITITTKDGDTHQMNIYTTNTNKESIEMFLLGRSSDKVNDIKITTWTTREADDETSEFLLGWLREV